MWFGASEESARAIEAKAIAALDDGEHDRALALADELLAMRWSGGFEIKALAMAGTGDREGATRVLEAALENVPDAWRLWHLLGNLRSDLGRADAALKAYDNAVSRGGSGEISLLYNRAIARHRRGDPGGALADLEPILALPRPPGPIAEDVLSLTARCLSEIGRAADGLAMVEDALSRAADDDPRRPRLHAEHAMALSRAGEREGAREAFSLAADAGIVTPGFLALGRSLLSEVKGPHVRYQLILQALTPDADQTGFLRVFDVVALSPDDATTLCVAHLDEGTRAGADVERCSVMEPASTLERGVHGVSPRHWFTEP
ncbi:MAG: tetratricopeptide repeat protein [Sandaracinaceae bacterium]